MNPKQIHYEKLANTIIKNLAKRNMEGCYCATAADACTKALSYVTSDSSVAFGGSMTLEEAGILAALRQRTDINLIDRSNAKTPDEIREMYLKAFASDFYFMSTNAITLDGELINIDGNGNRAAALVYGPKNIIIIAGMNKVAANAEEATNRVHTIAAPINCQRLERTTPCAATGVCADCTSEECICCHTVVTRYSRFANRIKVILVGEELGY